jgi:outer membrane protein assembly factor BamD
MTVRPALRALLLVAVLGTAAGCSGSQGLNAGSPQAAFTQGKELYDRGRFPRAIEYFQHVFDFGRAHEWAPEAQYYLAQSYFQTRQYLLAANEFTRFVELYRNDPRVEEGEYLRALSYVRLSPPYQLDQTDTHNALTYLRLYLAKYPNGQYAEEVGQHIEAMRYKLARKQFEIAQLYETRSMFQAAAIEYLRVLEQYPESEFADDALFGALRAYKAFADRSIAQRQPERYELAAEQYRRLAQLFPNSPVLREAEPVYQQVQAALARFEGTASR